MAEAGDTKGYRNRASEKAKEPAQICWRSPKTVDVRWTMHADSWALLERAMEGARRATDVGPEGMLSDSEALQAVARDAIAYQQASTPNDAADPRRNVVLYECTVCRRTELDTGAGSVVLDEASAAALGCSAKVRDLDTEGRIVKRGGQVPAAVMRAVRLRDRNRCRNHACGRRRYVDVHHIEHREAGGEHSRANCLCLCTTCHKKLHGGELFIEGDADGALTFYDADRKPIAATPQGDPDGSAIPRSQGDPDGSATEGYSDATMRVLAAMGTRGAWHPDTIVQATGLDVVAVTRALLILELDSRIRSNDVGLFSPCTAPNASIGT